MPTLLSQPAARAAVRLSEQGEAKARSARLRGRVAADTQAMHTARYGKEAARVVAFSARSAPSRLKPSAETLPDENFANAFFAKFADYPFSRRLRSSRSVSFNVPTADFKRSTASM